MQGQCNKMETTTTPSHDDRLLAEPQVFAPIYVSQHVCALVAATAARTAARLRASPDEIALAVSTAVQQVSFDAVQIGAAIPTPAPTSPPAFDASDNSFDVSSISLDASTELSTYASTDTSLSHDSTDVSPDSTDASAVRTSHSDASGPPDAGAPLLNKRQRRRQRQRLHRRPAQPDQHQQPLIFDMTANDESDYDHTPSDPIIEEETELDLHVLCGDIYRKYFLDGRKESSGATSVILSIIPTSCSYLDNCYQHNIISSCVSSTYDDDSQVVVEDFEAVPFSTTCDDEGIGVEYVQRHPICRFTCSRRHRFLFKYQPSHERPEAYDDVEGFVNKVSHDIIHPTLDLSKQPNYGRTLSDYSIQKNDYTQMIDHSIHKKRPIHPEIQARFRELLSKQPEDGRTLSDHSIQNDDTQMIDHSIQKASFVCEKRASQEAPARPQCAGTAPGATHDPDRGGARRPWIRPSTGTRAGDDPGAAAHGTAAPGAGDAPGASAVGYQLTELAELQEQHDRLLESEAVLLALVAGTRAAPDSKFKYKELDRLTSALQTVQLDIKCFMAATSGLPLAPCKSIMV